MNKVTFTHTRQNLSAILNQVAFREQTYIIERRGRQMAVLVPVKRLVLLERIAQKFIESKTPNPQP